MHSATGRLTAMARLEILVPMGGSREPKRRGVDRQSLDEAPDFELACLVAFAELHGSGARCWIRMRMAH
jgi:hypothetical protein